MINVIAGAGLVLGSFNAMAGPGWAFDYTGETVVQQTAGSSEKHPHKKKASSGGPGWAFDHQAQERETFVEVAEDVDDTKGFESEDETDQVEKLS